MPWHAEAALSFLATNTLVCNAGLSRLDLTVTVLKTGAGASSKVGNDQEENQRLQKQVEELDIQQIAALKDVRIGRSSTPRVGIMRSQHHLLAHIYDDA